MPKVNHPHSMWVWCCPRPDNPASQGWWRPEWSSTKGQWRLQQSWTPNGYFWGSETILGGNHIHKDSLADHIWWEVLDGWQSLETSHWIPGLSVGICRCSCRYSISVSITWWSIPWNWFANPRSCKWWLCFLLPECTYDDIYPQKYTLKKLKIGTIRGHLANGAPRTLVCSSQLDSSSETETPIPDKEPLFDYVYRSNVINDKKSWFMRMEVLDLIYHQFVFITNGLGWQPTTSPIFQPLTPQMLALVAAAIHCALSEYATGKKVTVIFSQDEYWGKFYTSTVIDCITAEASALINYTWWAASSTPPPQWYSSATIDAPQSPSVLLSLDCGFDISFSALYRLLCWRSSSRMGAFQSPLLFHSRLFISLPFRRCSACMGCSVG